MKIKQLKPHNIFIKDIEWDRAKKFADKKEVSVAQVIRDAITFYLDCKGY
jgi:hypothetical protein